MFKENTIDKNFIWRGVYTLSVGVLALLFILTAISPIFCSHDALECEIQLLENNSVELKFNTEDNRKFYDERFLILQSSNKTIVLDDLAERASIIIKLCDPLYDGNTFVEDFAIYLDFKNKRYSSEFISTAKIIR